MPRQLPSCTASVPSQPTVNGRKKSAARRSRAGGQPRSHAAPHPMTAGAVTDQAASASPIGTSHRMIRAALRISHKLTASLSQDRTLIAASPG